MLKVFLGCKVHVYIMGFLLVCAGWWLVNTGGNGDSEEGEEGGASLMGYVPASFLKKYEEGTQETTELEEKLVIGHAC